MFVLDLRFKVEAKCKHCKKTPKSHSKSCNSILDQTGLGDCSRSS